MAVGPLPSSFGLGPRALHLDAVGDYIIVPGHGPLKSHPDINVGSVFSVLLPFYFILSSRIFSSIVQLFLLRTSHFPFFRYVLNVT